MYVLESFNESSNVQEKSLCRYESPTNLVKLTQKRKKLNQDSTVPALKFYCS